MRRMVKKLEDMNIPSTIERTRSIYNTILGEIRRINNTEKVASSVDELMERKAISKSEFLGWLNKLKVEMPDDLWNQIHLNLISMVTDLLSGATFAAQEVLLPIISIVYLHATSVPRSSDWQSPMTLTLLKWKYGLTENWTM